MLKYLKNLFITKSQPQDTSSSNLEPNSIERIKEEIKDICEQNKHVIKEEEIAYWIIQKHLTTTRFILTCTMCSWNENDMEKLSKFIEILIVNELVHQNQQKDFTKYYNSLLPEYFSQVNELSEKDKLQVLGIIKEIISDTKLLSSQLLSAKSQQEWNEVWKCISENLQIDTCPPPKDDYYGVCYVSEFIKQDWLRPKEKKKKK